MTNIIGVVPTIEYLNLTWMIGSRCNYDCMYCPTELHDNTSAAPSLSTLKLAWNRFIGKTRQDLPVKLSFTGGEVTANRSFLPFVRWLKETQHVDQIIVTTNGSASKNYYLRLCGLVDAISFSTHSEFMDEARFFDTVKACNAVMSRPAKSVHINIMDEYWNRDRIEIYKRWCENHGISYSVNEIDYSKQTRDHAIMRGVLNLVT